jgi:hypothetical protein
MGRGGGSKAARGGGGGGGGTAAPATTTTEGGVVVGELTPGEREAVDDYSGLGFRYVNGRSRGVVIAGGRRDMAAVDRQIAALDAAVAKGKLAGTTTLYRGTDMKVLGDIEVGSVFRDKGFLSTSRSQGEARSFDHGAMLKITAPKGTRAADVSHHTGGFEKEILLGRNTNLKVTSITSEGGRPVINVTVVR